MKRKKNLSIKKKKSNENIEKKDIDHKINEKKKKEKRKRDDDLQSESSKKNTNNYYEKLQQEISSTAKALSPDKKNNLIDRISQKWVGKSQSKKLAVIYLLNKCSFYVESNTRILLVAPKVNNADFKTEIRSHNADNNFTNFKSFEVTDLKNLMDSNLKIHYPHKKTRENEVTYFIEIFHYGEK